MPRSDSARINAAKRAGLRAHLVSFGRMTGPTADAWIAAWDALATNTRDEPDTIDTAAAWAWISEERQDRAKP
jgi:hypothetical protein